MGRQVLNTFALFWIGFASLLFWLGPTSSAVEMYPFVLLAIGTFILSISKNSLSLSLFIFVALFYPTLAPSLAFYFTNEYLYSGWNTHLQSDLDLTVWVLEICFSSALAYTVGVIAFGRNKKISQTTISTSHLRTAPFWYYVFSFLFVFSVYLSEPGPSIIASSYSQVRPEENFFTGAFSSQLLILSWLVLFYFKEKHKLFFALLTTFGIFYLLLHGRRSEPLGMLMVLIFFEFYKVHIIKSIFSVVSIFSVFALVEILRDSGIANTGLDKILSPYSGRFFLPGGSNIMITLVDIVYLKDNNYIPDEDLFTFDTWLFRLIPSPILSVLGFDLRGGLEGGIIGRSHLPYMGGFHIIGIFYLNGGPALVIFFSFLLGLFSRYIDYVRDSGKRGLITLICLAFIFGSVRLFWYHPIGFFKMALYLSLVFYILKIRFNFSNAK